MRTTFWMTATATLAVAFVCGCGQTGTTPSQSEKAESAARNEETASVQKKDSGSDHSGWWCNEHGVPEGVCARCDSKLAAEFQKKGDWCKEHDRPDSQCFICHPELMAKFAAQYEAKFGKQPPKSEE